MDLSRNIWRASHHSLAPGGSRKSRWIAAACLLRCQHADSFFPSGAVSFSWGLEALRADGLVQSADDVALFAAGQLRHRWATAATDPSWRQHIPPATTLRPLLLLIDCRRRWRLPVELRLGSRRMGAALLGVHARLETPQRCFVSLTGAGGACAWSCRCGSGPSRGAVSGSSRGRHRRSAHCFCIGMIGAALRLGLIGHFDGQRLLREARTIELSSCRQHPSPSLMRFRHLRRHATSPSCATKLQPVVCSPTKSKRGSHVADPNRNGTLGHLYGG